MPSFSAIKKALLICLCLQGSAPVFAQKDSGCGEPDDKKAVELYNKGTDKKKYLKEQREAFLKQAIDLEPDYVAANFALAEEYVITSFAQQSPFDPAVPYFMTVIKDCPNYHSDPYYFVGISDYEAGKFADAITYLQKYIDFKDEDVKKYSKSYDDFLYDAKQKIKDAKQQSADEQLSQDIKSHVVPFDPHLVKGLSTQYDEFLAIISPDNQLAFYTRKMPPPPDLNSAADPEDNMKEYFMISHRKPDGTFDDGKKLPPPFNKGRNEGAPSITIDNNHLYFAISNSGNDGQLYCSDYANGEWGELQNLSTVNDPNAWTSQPSISSDGQTLYFASNRPGGKGKCDIWETQKDSNGNWGQPTDLPSPINTPGDELSPFIHSDSHTLYFSSDRPGGVGTANLDIYYSRMDSNGNWTKPKNIGYPINSDGDDMGFFVSTDGKTGYFCSNDPGRAHGETAGGIDIYEFELYPEARPERVALVRGKIADNDGNPLTGATVNITNTQTHKKASVMSDTTNASYTAVVNLSKNQQYVVSVNKKGYAFNSGVITEKDTFTGKPTQMDFDMQSLASGGNYVLNDIYYQTNSSQLEPISIAVVEEFARYMQANPGIKVKIAGYTDNVGGDQANLELSSDRARTVMQALIKEGIPASRLTYEGYGAANPVASNDTEEGRQKNRRTEFIIIQK